LKYLLENITPPNPTKKFKDDINKNFQNTFTALKNTVIHHLEQTQTRLEDELVLFDPRDGAQARIITERELQKIWEENFKSLTPIKC